MQKVYDDVLIFRPEVKTGGPEALHQRCADAGALLAVSRK
jgi:hypothetical protein